MANLRAPGPPETTSLALSERPDRARARALRDARVDHIVGLMANGWWLSARSTRELSKRWGVGMNTVHDYAREASGIIRRSVAGVADDIRSVVLAKVERAGELALQIEKHERVGPDEYERVRAPNVSAALQAYDIQLRALGLYPAQKLEIVTQEAWESLSVVEKRERLERAKARIAILEAQLPPVPVERE